MRTIDVLDRQTASAASEVIIDGSASGIWFEKRGQLLVGAASRSVCVVDGAVSTGDARADRAMAAMLPFVLRWGFPVNPEDVEEIVYAVLLHADSESGLEEIDRAVRLQIAEYMLRKRRLDLEAYGRLPPEQAAVRAVIDLLVARDYGTLELAAMFSERRFDLEQAVREYGRTLVAPEVSWWSTVTVTAVEAAGGGEFHIAAPLWTAKEGRSDLTLEARLIEDEREKFKIQLMDLHVL